MERTIVIFEDGQKIFARKYHVDSRANNLEKDMADFVFNLGKIHGKNMIEPMRVVNRLRVMCGRLHPLNDLKDMVLHPKEWHLKATVSQEDQFLASQETKVSDCPAGDV